MGLIKKLLLEGCKDDRSPVYLYNLTAYNENNNICFYLKLKDNITRKIFSKNK